MPIFMTGVPAGAARVEPRSEVVEDAVEPGVGRHLPRLGEREVRRCFRGASGDGELAISESAEMTSASWPCIAIIVSSSCAMVVTAAMARAVGSIGSLAPLP